MWAHTGLRPPCAHRRGRWGSAFLDGRKRRDLKMKKATMKRRTFGALAGGTLAAGATLSATMRPAAAATKVLRYVRNGNLTILDPIWTTAYVTRDHGYMVYDTLLAIDENNAV